MLESLDVRATAPYGDRAYEWVTAVATVAVDPQAPGNDRITDLALAPRDPDGAVRFHSDVRLLRPTGPGNGRALLVVPNRGMSGSLPFGADSVPFLGGPQDAPPPGDGYLLDQGWTIAWCGWQWDVNRDQGWLGLSAPLAAVEPGWLRVEFQSFQPLADHALSDSGPIFEFASYPTADLEDPEATLTVRTSPLTGRQTIPRHQWRFTGPTRFEVDGGFRAFHTYELVYRSAFAPVVGTGLLALRDLGSHLRADHDQVFAYGVSQCGRVLRELLHQGLNLDEAGKPVFDGVFAHLASARRGEFNRRYGQPALLSPLTPEYGPPHDTSALLERQRAVGGTPKLMLTNTAWEYWRGDGALVHQDPRTGDDLPEDPDARVHLLAGTDHIGPAEAYKAMFPVVNPTHSLDTALIVRALFVQLVQWTCDGIEPEPSRVPRQADGSAVTRDQVLAGFPELTRPDPAHLPWTPTLDPTATRWPLELGEPLVALVSAIDAHGNEVAGIRLPAVATGIAAYTGWNPRTRIEGLPDVLCELIGSRLPRRTAAPLPDEASLRTAARALVAARFLRPEDLETAVAQAIAELHRS